MAKAQTSNTAIVKSFEGTFSAMARAAGGVDRERAVREAETALVGMRASIDQYIDAELDRLQQAAAALSDGFAGQDEVEALYRPASGLRDVGSTAGFELMTEVARNLCEVLEAVQAGAECSYDVIECHVAAIQVSRQESYRGAGLEGAAALVAGLKTILRRFVPAED
jgi:hypothetical protein